MNPLPALKDAAYDRTLGKAKGLYLVLVYELDLQAYRELKQEYLATILGVDQATVSRGIQTLVAAGYLDRLMVPEAATRYRLVYRRTQAESATNAA